MYTRLFFLLFINVTIRSTFASRHRCDSEKNAIGEIQEGLLGETNLFPWLGVLKVYIRDEGDIIEALTGIVFITHTHALANAHEIAKIPEWIFKNIEAMFIPFHGKPWHVRILNYILHPEYRKATINTIALLTLKAENGSTLPLLPVCWTRKLYRNTEDLYIAGFTDEFVLLEKFVYKATNEDITSCDQFYEQEELNLGNRRPVNYVCVSTTTVKVSCVWDTGNALISNNTGYWVLVGFGVNGPGCSAPGRFIDILHYLPWIWSVVRAGMKTDTDGGARRADYDLLTDFSYQFDTEQHHYLYYEIQKISPTETVIHINEEKGTEKCYDQIYREITEIKAPDPFQRKTYVTYKLSIYDLHYENITCVRIKLNAATDQHAYLFVEKYIEHPEGAAHTEWGDTPQDILQYYPLRNESALKPKQKKNPADWTPGPNLKPESMRYPDTMTRTMIENHNVYMKFTFSGQASYDIKIYAKPHPDPLHLRPIELNDRIGTIYYNEPNKSDILACTDTAYQHGKVVAPVNTVTLYTMALKAAVFHATHISSCAVFVCDGDARKFSIDEIDQSVEEHTLKMLVTQIEYPTFQRIIDDSLKAKKKQEDLSKSATVTATGNGTAYIPEPYDIQRPANATSFGIGDVKTRIRVFDNYTTMETDITARVFSNHSTPFGLYVIRPRTYTLHRWCIIPLENSTIPRCYSGDEYHDDNIPPEYSNIG